ncbi:lytic transglycosylase domain-containing protein [Nocardia arthritidis]|uniref:Lytic transglycosylase n=1 Tax=Nocardia arthritidis TaxID=228602 RepID=A0A6G9YR25_9NOCA|nr:lytic murein transglycosylase [Nocardia arthritidis]QIS15353.1 lytic transglycosylase [Nocardia arthritidis]
MRISAPITVSALVVAGLVATGSASHTTPAGAPPQAPEALLAAASSQGKADDPSGSELSRTVGLLPVTADPPRKLTAMAPSDAPFAAAVPLQDIALPNIGGALGIPEIVLAAYRNAELAMQSAMPNCGLHWSLLAGIGRIESGHAAGGRTDANGTTVTPIYGPALDGALPGNEVIKNVDGSYVRAIGPMQFLPGTWTLYASDGNGDGVADPNNVFDATLAAGKYLCAGGLDLRDPAQELRAVLRYNNSMAYAANVLSWATAYRTGGVPTQVTISPDLIPPGSSTQIPDMTAVSGTVATTNAQPPQQQTTTPNAPAPAPTQVMINIPGLPPIPCGIFCPPPKPVNPCDPQVVQAPIPGMPALPGLPGNPATPLAPGQTFGATNGDPNDPAHPQAQQPGQPDPSKPASCTQPQQQAGGPAQPAPQPNPQQAGPQQPAPEQAVAPAQQTPQQSPGEAVQSQQNAAPEVVKTPEAAPPPAAAPTTAPPPPGITLPGGFVIPLPAPPQ